MSRLGLWPCAKSGRQDGRACGEHESKASLTHGLGRDSECAPWDKHRGVRACVGGMRGYRAQHLASMWAHGRASARHWTHKCKARKRGVHGRAGHWAQQRVTPHNLFISRLMGNSCLVPWGVKICSHVHA